MYQTLFKYKFQTYYIYNNIAISNILIESDLYCEVEI